MALQQLSQGGASSTVSPATDPTSTNSFNFQQYLSMIANTPNPDTTSFESIFQYTPSSGSTSKPFYETSTTAPVNPLQTNVTTPSQPSNINSGLGPQTSGLAPSVTGTNLWSLSQPFQGGTGTETEYQINAPPNITIDPFVGSNPNVFIEHGGSGTGLPQDNYPWDPFSFFAEGEGGAFQAQGGTPATSESQSQGYQQFGQTWLDLLNTISQNNLQWGGLNQQTGELKGGGSVGPWLTQNITTPWSSGNQQQAYSNSLDFISKQTGLNPSSQEAQSMAGAFLEYTLQNADKYGLNSQNFAQRNAGGEKNILGDLGPVLDVLAIIQPELTPLAIAGSLASAGEDFSQGNLIGGFGGLLGAAGGASGFFSDAGLSAGLDNSLGITDFASSVGPQTLSDASTLGGLATAGNVLNLASAGVGIGQGISEGNPLGILSSLGGAVSPISGLSGDLGSSGTSGTNAPTSGGVISGISDTLGITPQQLTEGVGYAAQGAPLVATAVPLIENATTSSPNLNLAPVTSEPPAAAPAPTVVPSAPGQPLKPETIENPAQLQYQMAKNPNLMQLLLSLGEAA